MNLRRDRSAAPGRRIAPLWVVPTVLALVLSVLTGLSVAGAPPATAADLSRFDPGLIITDQAFTNTGTMDVAGVQAFLDQRGSACRGGSDGSPCLKDVRLTTAYRAPDDKCAGGLSAGSNRTAADVIVEVARSCGINPQVLLVTLQKEQGLVTTTAPTATKYRSAMGYGCPDTAACDERYYGLVNQLFQASWQFRNYTLNPTRYSYRAGVVNAIRYYPASKPECGAGNVLIRNQATANLYNYTPYQPNAAALAAGYGTGDACSSYGNRNFYNYFSDWFGRPDAGDAGGAIDVLRGGSTDITLSGWALDPSTSASIQVHVYVDGVGTGLLADQSRPDVAAVYGLGDKHGFSASLPASAGDHTVCVYAIGDRGRPNALLGCRVVTVDQPAGGAIDGVRTDGSTVTVTGWTWDPDTSDPTAVHIYIDGVGVALAADQSRPDVAAALGTSATRGFSHTRTLSPGHHTACVYAINYGTRPHTLLGCREFSTDVAAPTGSIDTLTITGDTLTVTGWTWDPDTTGPTDVHVYVDGVGVALRADQARPDVAAAFGIAPTRGYTHSRTVAPGTHTVCVYAMNTGPGAHTLLGCPTVTSRATPPTGNLETVRAVGGQVTVSGWTWDPDTSSTPTDVHVYIDGVGVAIHADQPRPDVAAVFGIAPERGFLHTRPVAPGAHTACVYAMNTGPGAHTLLGCRDFTA